ncbi:MAG: cation transporter [Gemmataceae bacterium]|nr:cation transporter [Gemmataceae bacterium]
MNDGRDCCASPVVPPRKAEGRAALWAAAGSVVSAVVASACCWLPLLLLAFGVSAAGVSATFAQVRPFFLLAAAVLLATGFYLTYVRKQVCAPGSACAVPNPKLRRFNQVMLWVATVLVLAFALFPNYVGSLLGDGRARDAAEDAARSALVHLSIQGMTCEACAVRIEQSLKEVPGVRQATVSYAAGRARVMIDPTAPPSDAALLKAVEKAGYEATVAGVGGAERE